MSLLISFLKSHIKILYKLQLIRKFLKLPPDDVNGKEFHREKLYHVCVISWNSLNEIKIINKIIF